MDVTNTSLWKNIGASTGFFTHWCGRTVFTTHAPPSGARGGGASTGAGGHGAALGALDVGLHDAMHYHRGVS